MKENKGSVYFRMDIQSPVFNGVLLEASSEQTTK